jgi:hypothetical protein
MKSGFGLQIEPDRDEFGNIIHSDWVIVNFWLIQFTFAYAALFFSTSAIILYFMLGNNLLIFGAMMIFGASSICFDFIFFISNLKDYRDVVVHTRNSKKTKSKIRRFPIRMITYLTFIFITVLISIIFVCIMHDFKYFAILALIPSLLTIIIQLCIADYRYYKQYKKQAKKKAK